MPVLTGIDLVKILPDPPSIIFTTAYREYAVESYDLHAIDYLVKPITYVRFLKAINKLEKINTDFSASSVIHQNEQTEKEEMTKDSIYVNVNKKYIKVIFNDILYIESVKDYIHIHLDTEKVITKSTISDFFSKLPKEFIRVHRSYIVNRRKLTAYTHHDIEINTKEIPIGKSYRHSVIDILNS